MWIPGNTARSFTSSTNLARLMKKFCIVRLRAFSAAPPTRPPRRFFGRRRKKRPSRAPKSPVFAGSGRNWRRRTQPEPGALGALGGAGRIVFGAKSRRPPLPATRLSSHRFVVLIASFPAANQCQSCARCRAGQPPLMPHGRRSEGRTTTAATRWSGSAGPWRR